MLLTFFKIPMASGPRFAGAGIGVFRLSVGDADGIGNRIEEGDT